MINMFRYILKTMAELLVKDMPRIFERGFTSTANRNETTSSGIGLYLVNSVKDQLGIHQVPRRLLVGDNCQIDFPITK